MPSFAPFDLSGPAHLDLGGLALMAGRGDREVRPLLLTLQTQLFVGFARRDRRALLRYEALAVGLIPLVGDDVLSAVAAMLAAVADAPTSVTALIEARLGRGDEALALARCPALDRADLARLVVLDRADIDLALARNGAVLLDAHALRSLVDRAIHRRDLAATLLERPDLSVFDRAALYRAERDPTARDRLREELRIRLATSVVALPRPSAARVTRLRRLALRQEPARVMAEIAAALRIAPEPDWRTDDAVEAELFALALAALGLTPDDCLATILTLAGASALAPHEVSRLAEIAASTPISVAAHLAGAGSAPPARKRPRTAPEAAVVGPRRSRRPAVTDAREAPPPDRAATVRPGRRSRSATGPDRT